MNSFVEMSLRNFCSTNDMFGGSGVYGHFESNEKEDGINSGVMFGKIVYRNEKNEKKVSVPLMLKMLPAQHYYKDYVLVQYFNEIFFYTRALPLFQQLGNLQSLIPTFYDSYVNYSLQGTEIVLMCGDLKAKGFRNHQRFSFLDLEHLTLMLLRLGQFHSYSYLAKSRCPQEFKALGAWFHYAEAELIRSRSNYFYLFAQMGLQRLKQDPRYGSHIERVEKVLQNADALVLQVNTMEREEPMSVLCHGDYLRGNVMFRYENGQPKDMKLIDMATTRIGSPVIDLSLVLYLNANQQTRNEHWNRLIDAYYQGLCLECGGIGVPSKESILKEFTTKSLYGFFIASHFLPAMIEKDRTNEHHLYFDSLPTEYSAYSPSEIPEPVFKDMINGWCKEEGAEALADILRDMVDRRFI